jgi:hypothetical protein
MKNYKKNITSWNKTLKFYVNWVANTDLRSFFAKELKIHDLSLWWVTNICSKQNMLNNSWYHELNKILNDKKKINYNKIIFYLIFFSKFLKNFINHFFWFLIVKFISFTRFKVINQQNCFHSLNYNILKKDNFLFDRCYGNLPFTNSVAQNFHLISIEKKTDFFYNLFKVKKFKKKIPYIIVDEYLSVFEIFKVYFLCLFYFFKLKKFIFKNKKVFLINKHDCSGALEPFLLMSFAGEIQTQIFRGIAINNFLKNKKTKLFINYAEFNPGYRSIYFFIRNINKPPKIITIQHGHSNKNLMFFNHKKKEFTKNKINEGGFYSPSPDFYLIQGDQFKKILSLYFPNKTKIIGCLKYDSFNFKKKNNNIKLKKIKSKQSKKIILLCPSIGDELRILDYLKQSVNFNFRYILSPHPVLSQRRSQVVETYKSELKSKCNLEVYDDVSTFDLLSISNLVICGFSSVAYEALFFGAQSIRVVNSKHPQFFDLSDNLPVAYSPDKLKNLLSSKSLLNIRKSSINKLLKNYFYKFDNKAHKRFWNFVNTI